jgi:hypothetical protein
VDGNAVHKAAKKPENKASDIKTPVEFPFWHLIKRNHRLMIQINMKTWQLSGDNPSKSLFLLL